MQKYLSFILILLLLTSCLKKEDEVELEKVSFSELKGFENDDASQVYEAFQKSCEAILSKTGEFIDTSFIKINRDDYINVCSKSSGINPQKFKDFIKFNFTPYLPPCLTKTGSSKFISSMVGKTTP